MRFRLSGLAPFRQPFFRRQWPADIATSWGFEIETLVLGWYILATTGSVLWLTAFASVQYLGTLISPMFGVVADRIGHRTLLCAMRGIYALLAAVLAAMALTDTLGPVQVMAVAFLAGLVRPSDLGMRSALIAASMPAALLAPTMGISRSSADSARVMGALAGAGLTAALGIGLTYVVVTALYLLSLALTMAASPARRPVATGGAASPWRDLGDGFAHLRATPPLLATILLAFLVNLAAYPVSGGLLPYVAREVYGIDRTGLGYLVASFAGGGLLGSIWLIMGGGARHPARAMLIGCAVWFPLLMVFAQTRDAWSGMAMMALAGFSQSFVMIPMSVILLRCAQERFRGRIMGVRILAVYGLPLGLLLSGPMIEWVGYTTTVTGYAIFGMICAGAIAWRWRQHLWPRDAAANA